MPDVDRGADPREEQVGLEVDLTVGDRDDVGRDVGRDVVALGLDDRQRRERTRPEPVRELRRALEQPGVQVEDVARVRLPPRRPPEQQGERPVGGGLLGQVVVHGERVQALVHPVRAEGRSRVRGEVLERRRVRGRSVHDHRVVERAVVAQRLDHLGHGGRLLADRDVDAADLPLRVAAGPVVALGDDRVDRDGGLAGLSVADDELPLAAPDRRHRVDRRDPGLQGLLHRLAVDDVGGLDLEHPRFLRRDRTLPVERDAERIDDPPEEPVTDGDRKDPAGLLDEVALLDLRGLTQDDAADLVLVEVEREAEHAAGELEELARHRAGETLHARDAVAGLDHAADLLTLDRRRVALDVLPQRLGDVLRIEAQLVHCHRVTRSLSSFRSGARAPPAGATAPTRRRSRRRSWPRRRRPRSGR